jgi:hypothetical protein
MKHALAGPFLNLGLLLLFVWVVDCLIWWGPQEGGGDKGGGVLRRGIRMSTYSARKLLDARPQTLCCAVKSYQ